MSTTNESGTLLPSAARTASTLTPMLTNLEHRGVVLILDVTVGAAAQTLTPQVEVYLPSSDTWEPITAFPATAAAFVGEKVYIVYPGAVETAAIADQEVAGIPLPQQWRVNIAHSGAVAWTYSLDYSLCV